MTDKPYKRRKIQIVEGGMQSHLSMQLTAWLYVFLVVFSFIVYAPAFLAIFTGDSGSVAYAEAVAQFEQLPLLTLVPLALTSAGMAATIFLFSNRIAGPVFRFKRVLRDMAQRKFGTPLQLRKADVMKDLAAELNATLKALREDAARLEHINRTNIEAARRLVDACTSDTANPQVLTSLAREVLENAKSLDQHVNAAYDANTLAEHVEIPETDPVEEPEPVEAASE